MSRSVCHQGVSFGSSEVRLVPYVCSAVPSLLLEVFLYQIKLISLICGSVGLTHVMKGCHCSLLRPRDNLGTKNDQDACCSNSEISN